MRISCADITILSYRLQLSHWYLVIPPSLSFSNIKLTDRPFYYRGFRYQVVPDREGEWV